MELLLVPFLQMDIILHLVVETIRLENILSNKNNQTI